MQFMEFTAARADTGVALPLAKVTVYLAGTTTKAALFDSAGASLANPVSADSNGTVGFAAANGTYDISVASEDGSYTAPTIHKVELFDAITSSGRSVSLTEFGLRIDGLASSSAANSAAFTAFGVWARAESAAGRAVAVTVPAGTYYFDYGASKTAFYGIKKLRFTAYGANFLNTQSGYTFPWPASASTLLYASDAFPNSPTARPRINTALKGATSVTSQTPSVLTQFSPGEIIMVAGLDLQYGGYPPNLNAFDFVTVKTVDTTTGVVTFQEPLTNDYIAEWPEYDTSYFEVGSPRLYKLDNGGYTWNVDHTFEGFRCANPTEDPQVGGQYVIAMGRKVTFRDCNVPGFVETICEDFYAERCVERIHTEPDKLVKRSKRVECDLQAGLILQSGSIDSLAVEGCKITAMSIGCKNLSARDCEIMSLGYGGNYGFNSDTLFENCRVHNANNFYPYAPFVRAFVDGTNVQYANGIFTVMKNNLTTGGGLAGWNCVPGQVLQFSYGPAGNQTPAGAKLASDLGTGVVLKIEDGTDRIVITTTLPDATVPAWSSGQVVLKRRNPIVMRNCTGTAWVRAASEADKAGKVFGEYARYVLLGESIGQHPTLQGQGGKLVRLYANVIKPKTNSPGSTFEMTTYESLTASTMGSPVIYSVKLDITKAGIREFDLKGLSGKLGSDAVTYGGVAQSALVPTAWMPQGLSSGFFNTPAGALADAPIIEIILEYDLGLFGKRFAVRADAQTGAVLIGTTGLLP